MRICEERVRVGGAMARDPRGWRRSPIVVGADDSEESRRAVEWAAGEASASGRALRIVHVLPFEHAPRHPGPEPFVEEAAMRVGDLADHARVVSGLSLPVSTDVVDGLPTKALLEESRRSSMVVLGSRDLGRLGRVLLGSTAAEVAARASSPVVVIPRGAEPSPHRTGIVVGVDGARESEAALKFAFAWAHRHDARLTALHAWDAPGRGMRRAASAADDALEAAAEDLLARTLAPWRKHYPGVLVDAKVVRGTAIGELGRASADAQLVVVGARFRSAWAVAAPGSVSQALLHSATGPVAVVRASEQDASRSPA